MSILSVLGKIGKTALNIGTGGIGGSVLDAIGGVSGKASKGSADQRLQEAQLGLQNQQLLQQGARDQFSAGMQGAEFQRQEQDRQRKAAILSQLLNNTQDASITPGNPDIARRMPTVIGGARPSNLTTNRDALLALLSQMGPQAPTYQAPPAFAVPTAGKGEKILGGIGLGASLLGALGPLFGRGRTNSYDDMEHG